MLHKAYLGNYNELILTNTYLSGKEKWLKVSCVKANNEEL